MLSLRHYQLEAIRAFIELLVQNPSVRGIVQLPMGCGKTRLAIGLVVELAEKIPGFRVLWLAHTDELIEQPRAAFRELAPELEVGIVQADRDETAARNVVVGSIQTVSMPARLARMIDHQRHAGEFKLVVIDECFPAGTVVGGLRIEDIRPGDEVPSYDEASGHVVPRRVITTFASPCGALVRIVHQRGQITCTPNHPVMTARWWVPAVLIQPSDLVIYDEANDLRPVRCGDRETGAPHQHPDLLRSVQGREKDSADEGPRRAVYRVREDGVDERIEENRRPQLRSPRILFSGVPSRVHAEDLFGDDGADEQEVCGGAYARAQPDGARGDSRESVVDPARDGARAARPRRERSRTDGGGGSALGGDWVGADHCAHQDPSRERLPHALQDRCRVRGDECCGGDRRALALRARAAGAGHEEGRIPAWARVDRVEVLERGCDGRYGGLCPDGLVYNLEVEGTHTYVADGVVVHNCHHGVSPSYRRVLDAFPTLPVLGLTGTPERADEKPLGRTFPDGIIYRLSIHAAIAGGWLVPPRAHRIVLPEFDPDQIKVTARGDYDEDDLENALLRARAAEATAVALKQAVDAGRKPLAFVPKVVIAEKTAEAARAVGVECEWISGETPRRRRREILAAFARREVPALANVAVLTEGWDDPSVDAIVMARPTRSRSLYCQMAGRGLRLDPLRPPGDAGGKKDCVVYDLVGAHAAHGLQTADAILAASEDEEDDVATAARRTKAAPPITNATENARLRQFLAYVSGEMEMEGATTEHNVRWLVAIRDRALVLAAGEDGTVLVERASDAPAFWHAVLEPKDHHDAPVRLTEAPVSIELAQAIGENYARLTGSLRLSQRDAKWRERAPSDGLLRALRAWRVATPPEGVTAGQASDLLKISIGRARHLSRANRPAHPRVVSTITGTYWRDL